jgi:hypothetical protein
MYKIIALLLVMFSITSTAQTKYSLLDVPSDLLKNANSVLLYEKVITDVSEPGKLNLKSHQVRIVLNKNGNNHVSTSVEYDKATKIKKIEAYVFDSFGNEIEHYKKKDFKDVSAVDGYSIFSDNRRVYLNYTPTSYPYIVEFIFETENNSTLRIPPWYPTYGYNKSTKNSEYVLKFDPSNKPRIKSDNLEGYDITLSENPSEIVCTAQNISAFKYEELSPLYSKIVPNVSFALNNFTLMGVSGSAKNWEEFGTWMNKSLLNNVDDIPEATIVEVKNLIHNETTNEAKARIIYNYLQEKVRYISIHIGIGGWRPMLASDVDKLSYGDCKALTNYTKTLLDAVGIPSYYTILYSSEREMDFDKDFSRLQGNHAILGIPDGDDITWLECTSQKKPYGFIGSSNDDRDVLIVTPEGGKIVHTKIYPHHESLQESEIQIRIKNNGSASANFISASTGLQYGNKYWIDDLDNDEIIEHYKDRWDNINGFTIEKINLENNRDSIIFTEELIVEIPNYCSKIGNDFLCAINVFNKSSYVPPRMKERKNELYLYTEFEDIDHLTLEIPSGYQLDELPKNKSIENEFGTYIVTFEKLSENTLAYKRIMIFKKGTHPKEKYNDYRAFRRSIAKFDKTKIVLKQK